MVKGNDDAVWVEWKKCELRGACDIVSVDSGAVLVQVTVMCSLIPHWLDSPGAISIVCHTSLYIVLMIVKTCWNLS